MDQFIKLIGTLSIPQLDNLRDEMLRQKQLNFNTDPNFPLKLDAIGKEIRLAKGYELGVPNKQLKHGFFGAPKRLNPYNALGNVAPKNKLGLKQGVPGMVLSELLTYNAAVPLSILYAKTLNKDTVAGFKNAFGIGDKEGKGFAYRSDYERAKDELEWKNAAQYYEYLTRNADPETLKNPREFMPDILLDLPEFAEGKHLYKNLREKQSELLKAPKNTYYEKTHGEPGKGLAQPITKQKF